MTLMTLMTLLTLMTLMALMTLMMLAMPTMPISLRLYYQHVEFRQRMKGLSTWAPDWTYRQENPRHRLLKSIPFEKWYDNEIERRGAPKFNYDPNNFHNGAFTSKSYRLSSILQLGRVLDTTSFELSQKMASLSVHG
jgi:hypothetical protein